MTPDVQIRRADRRDLPHLIELRETWRGRDETGQLAQRFTAWFEQEAATRWWWLASQAGTPVGMVNLKLFDRMPAADAPPTRWGHLSNLFVAPAHRDQGIGSALVADLLETSRHEGLVRLVLNPTERSVPIYRRHGFTDASGLLAVQLRDEIR